MKEDLKLIAARIREMREICGFSVDDICEYLDLPKEIYEGYEQSGEDIPINVLYRLTQKFGIDLTELLTGKKPHLDTYCVVRSGEGVDVDRYFGYKFKNVAHRFINRVMEPLIVTVEPSDAPPEKVVHSGQEFNYVLEGSMFVYFDNQKIELSAGDSIYFNPTHPHAQAAAGGKKAVFLTVITQ